jgi:hypothetical protein
MSAKRINSSAVASGSKKPCLQYAFRCPNPDCSKSFKALNGLHIHFSKSRTCAAVKLSKTPRRAKNVLPSPPVDNEEALTEFPWDDEASVEESDEASVVGSEDESTGGASNNNAGVYRESANEAALRFGIRFTTTQFHETKLLKILSDANAPHYLYKDIMEWGRAARHANYNFAPRRSSRNAQMKYLEKWLNCQGSRPEQIPTTLPGRVPQVVETTCFHFITQLATLVQDRVLFGNIDNLDVNADNPFGKYISPTGLLSTINSGQWYNTAYHHEVTDPSKDFVMPIIMACDETYLRKGGKASSWPLVFTTSILNQKMRNLPIAWRTLGYINDLSLIQSSAEAKVQSKELKAERLHSIFKTILASLIEAQQAGVLDDIPLVLGHQTKRVNIKVPVSFIIGDMQGGDKICCTSCSYSNKLSRLCRKCNVRGDQSGDPLVQCKKMSMVKIMQLVREDQQETLDQFNQYNVHNAWFDVSYGGCRFGIFSAACPIEPLHSIENGIIPDCLTILFKDEMSSSQKPQLDSIVRRLSLLPRQRFASSGAETSMPRLLWKDGVTSLTDLSAKLKVGIMFTIVVVSLQEEGSKFLTSVLGTPQRVNEMRQVFQMLLSYWVWLKRDTYWERGKKAPREAARQAIRVMLRELMRLWPRERGQGWEKAKIHEQLHVPDDIERNGAPQGSHTGPTEHNHIRLVKRPAKGTQQRAEVLDKQLGQRVSDAYIVDMAYQRMTTNYDPSLMPVVSSSMETCTGLSSQGAKGWLFVETNDNLPATFQFDLRNTKPDYFSTEMVQFLVEHYATLPPHNTLPSGPGNRYCHRRLFLSTEYKRDGVIFRGHANYRHTGPWYDWVMLRWSSDNHQQHASDASCHVAYGDDETIALQHLYAPGQILGFVCPTPVDWTFDNEIPVMGDVMAVVSTCDYSHSRESVFSTKWKQAYIYHAGNRKTPNIQLVEPDAIVRHCLMVPDEETHSSYNEIWCQELWGNEFNDCT